MNKYLLMENLVTLYHSKINNLGIVRVFGIVNYYLHKTSHMYPIGYVWHGYGLAGTPAENFRQ